MESKIRSLLEIFFKSNSSIEEEQILKEFFLKNNSLKDLKAYQPLFQYFNSEKSVVLENENFRQQVIDSIISDLVEKYFEGETSVKDELNLKAYFSGESVSQSLKSFQPIFDYSENQGSLSLGTDFDLNLKTEIITSTLDQYFEGESSIEDEQELKKYFSGNEVAPSLEKYTSLFEYFEAEASPILDNDFQANLKKKLLASESQPIIRRLTPQMWRVAAMLAFVVGALWFIDFDNTPLNNSGTASSIDWSKYEPEDPEEAYEKTMAALAMVSTKMKEGQDQTIKGFSKINSANDAAGF